LMELMAKQDKRSKEMSKKEYLTEENYQRTKRKISKIALIILLIGILIGGSIITVGIIKQSKINYKYSEENKEKVSKKLEKEKQNLLNKKAELEAKGIKYNSFVSYTDGEAYDLYIITNVLDPSFDRCFSDEYKDNSLTSNYCSLKHELDDIKSEFNKSFDSHDSIPFYIFGAFVIISSCMIAVAIYMMTKQREMLAFSAQQVMPIAQEGMEKMAPSVGRAGASIAKEMAPVYGEIAKEISKGIKEGMNETGKKKE